MHTTRLRAERLKRDMTQQNLADLLGVDRSSIAVWEARRYRPRRRPAALLTTIFGLSLDDLLNNDDETPKGLVSTNHETTAKTSEVRHGS